MAKIIEVPGLGQVEFPDNMDDYHIAAKIKQHLDAIPRDVTQDMSGMEKFNAGVGKAFVDIGRGVGNIVTDIAPGAAKYGFATRADTDAAKKTDANLMKTGAGLAGNISGNITALAPSMLLPGAATIAGGITIGALNGMLQPVGTEDNRGANQAIGGTVGAAVPAALRLAQAGRAALVDPFTESGRGKIAARVLRKAAADPEAVQAKLAAARGATPGFNPTVGQAADDAGVAALERTVRATDPAGFDAVDKAQRGALVDALRGIAGTPEGRAQAVAAAEANAKNLYGAAFKENVDVTPTLTSLSRRPSMQQAEARAQKLASEMGMPYQARLADMQPRTLPIPPRNAAPSSVIEPAEKFNPYSNPAPKPPTEISVPGEQISGSGSFELPPVESVPVRDMHTLKMGMDALLSDPMAGIAKREATAIKNTRGALLDQLPESYQQARLAHIDMMKPVNQMDIGQELYNRFVPALSDASKTGLPFRTTANSYATALRNGDLLAQRTVGLKNATMEGTMEPSQMQTLRGVSEDAASHAAMQDIGRGSGSDSVQKLAMSNLASEAGVPNWMANVARVPGGWMKRAGTVLYGDADEQIREQLADMLRNPQKAAAAMQAAGVPPSKIAEILRRGAQAGTLGASQSLNNQQQN